VKPLLHSRPRAQSCTRAGGLLPLVQRRL
jgi:hypothetical protein